MPADYSIYVLGESQISISGGGQLDGVTQGDGSHLNGLTITLNSGAWAPIEISDDDASFSDNDGNQRLFGAQTVDGVTYATNTQVEAEYGITLSDGVNTWQLVGFNVNNSSPSFGTIEGLAFIGGPGGFPPVGVALTVVGTSEGPSFTAASYATPVCVIAGTMVMTPQGERAIEEIVAGDAVITRDHGIQVVRWTDASRFEAKGLCAPVEFAVGVLGNTVPLSVSQQHRVLVEGWQAELLFGEETVLVPALHLLNDTTVRLRPGGTVAYHHMLLDMHAVIQTNGAWTESFHPGGEALRTVSAASRAALMDVLPSLNDEALEADTACGYPVLKRHEGTLMHL